MKWLDLPRRFIFKLRRLMSIACGEACAGYNGNGGRDKHKHKRLGLGSRVRPGAQAQGLFIAYFSCFASLRGVVLSYKQKIFHLGFWDFCGIVCFDATTALPY